MAHIFVSYAPEDSEFADHVVHWLERSRLTPWIDSQSEEMSAGRDWRAEIDKAIRDACALIAIMSPEAKALEHVTYEWTFALGVGVRVVPVLLVETDLPPRLQGSQPLDFTRRAARPWDDLIKLLKEIEAEHQFMLANLPQVAPPSLRQMVAALKDHNLDQLRQAVDTLSQIEDWGAREALVAILRHPSRPVRTAIALALARRGDTRTIPNLLEAMRDSSREIQQAALRALVDMDPDAVLELLGDVLADDDRRARWAASRVDRSIPRHIFISYSHSDKAYMVRLRDDLHDERLMVWTDEALTPGTASWQVAIQDAIENAGCLVVILSPDAKQSIWVREEIDHARLHRITIFPVLARGDEANAVPFGFASAQWTDIRTNYSEAVEKLTAAIHRHLRALPPARSTASAAPIGAGSYNE